jgi:hypothetical protein
MKAKKETNTYSKKVEKGKKKLREKCNNIRKFAFL